MNAATVSRWLWYLTLFGAIGACGIRGVARRALPRALPDDRPLRWQAEQSARDLGLYATVALLAVQAFRLYLQTRAFLDPSEPFTRAAVQPVLASAWGSGWSAQTYVSLLACAGFLVAGRRARAGWSLATTAALGLAATAPLTGHATESPWGTPVGVTLQALHLLAGGLWLGSLLGLVLAGFGATRRLEPGQRAAAMAALVRTFSPLALVGAGGAVLLGVVMGYAYIGSLGALWSSTYGRALLLKVGLLAVVAGFGAYNWRRVTPRLGDAAALPLLRRSATTELVVGALLLAVTAVLVALPAPRIAM
ncbi:MAG TPA: CopD family protein [Gemmatimonadales bacterium]|nr:CopD family protein [Gemmatimonadales bacterium]